MGTQRSTFTYRFKVHDPKPDEPSYIRFFDEDDIIRRNMNPRDIHLRKMLRGNRHDLFGDVDYSSNQLCAMIQTFNSSTEEIDNVFIDQLLKNELESRFAGGSRDRLQALLDKSYQVHKVDNSFMEWLDNYKSYPTNELVEWFVRTIKKGDKLDEEVLKDYTYYLVCNRENLDAELFATKLSSKLTYKKINIDVPAGLTKRFLVDEGNPSKLFLDIYKRYKEKNIINVIPPQVPKHLCKYSEYSEEDISSILKCCTKGFKGELLNFKFDKNKPHDFNVFCRIMYKALIYPQYRVINGVKINPLSQKNFFEYMVCYYKPERCTQNKDNALSEEARQAYIDGCMNDVRDASDNRIKIRSWERERFRN